MVWNNGWPLLSAAVTAAKFPKIFDGFSFRPVVFFFITRLIRFSPKRKFYSWRFPLYYYWVRIYHGRCTYPLYIALFVMKKILTLQSKAMVEIPGTCKTRFLLHSFSFSFYNFARNRTIRYAIIQNFKTIKMEDDIRS